MCSGGRRRRTMGMRTRRGPAMGLAGALITALSVVAIVGGAKVRFGFGRVDSSLMSSAERSNQMRVTTTSRVGDRLVGPSSTSSRVPPSFAERTGGRAAVTRCDAQTPICGVPNKGATSSGPSSQGCCTAERDRALSNRVTRARTRGHSALSEVYPSNTHRERRHDVLPLSPQALDERGGEAEL